MHDSVSRLRRVYIRISPSSYWQLAAAVSCYMSRDSQSAVGVAVHAAAVPGPHHTGHRRLKSPTCLLYHAHTLSLILFLYPSLPLSCNFCLTRVVQMQITRRRRKWRRRQSNSCWNQNQGLNLCLALIAHQAERQPDSHREIERERGEKGERRQHQAGKEDEGCKCRF